MVAERERIFIVGVGCTAFTKVQTISASLCKAQPHTTQSHSREANDKPTKYDVHPLDLHHNHSHHAHRWAWRLQQRHSWMQVHSGLFGTSLLSDAGALSMLAPGITYDAIEAAFVGYVFGASTCGQAALYQLGLTGIPITNVNNNCATGSTA